MGKRNCVLDIAQVLIGSSLKNNPDFIEVTTEKKSIGIETIRELLQRLTLKPVAASHILVLIENAEILTTAAANALLKTLEEPPPYVLFFLLTTSPDQLLLTIRSRCQKVHFAGDMDLHRRQSENLLQQHPHLRELVLPLFQKKKTPFAEASKVSETLAKESHDLGSVFTLLQSLWHDAMTWKETSREEFLVLPQLKDVSGALAIKSAESLSDGLDAILETERAIDGNVNKTLALERLLGTLGGA